MSLEAKYNCDFDVHTQSIIFIHGFNKNMNVNSKLQFQVFRVKNRFFFSII